MRHFLVASLVMTLALAACAGRAGKVGGPMPAADITLTPDVRGAGTRISEDFLGFSFESRKLLPDEKGRYYFRTDDAELISLFKSLGVKSLRIGGNTADRASVPIPTDRDIDSLYAFARVAGVSVIYNLRLKNIADPADDVRIAKYIMTHYAALTSCFTIGNEPDMYFKEYPAYLAAYKRFSAAILAEVPGARFCGPSTAGHQTWAANLAQDVPNAELAFLSLHTYPGGNGQAAGTPSQAWAHILSPDMEAFYQTYAGHFAGTAAAHHLGFRLEECNSLYNGGASNISNTYAEAVWALDFMYWWASHGTDGVNFHTGTNPDVTSRIPGGYDAFWIPAGGIKLHPLSYALKTFDVGAHGEVIPMRATTTLRGPANYTAYAVRNGAAVYLTIMNRHSTPDVQDLSFAIDAGDYSRAEILPLLAPNNDAGALEGLTLGGAPISGNGEWTGSWAVLSASGRPNAFVVRLPATSAMVVKLTR